jgi:dTMP kinase
MKTNGKFIVLEGIDGCGKTTQLENLRKRLSDRCRASGTRKVFVTREPSDSVPGALCRGIAKRAVLVEPVTEALLYAADRCEHVVREILPQRNAGNHVLCDRFYLSSFAYQSAGIDMDSIYQYNKVSLELAFPDATVFLDVAPEECERRRSSHRAASEKYENTERLAFTYKQYQASFSYLAKQKDTMIIIDGNGDPGQVFETLWAELMKSVFTENDFR